MADLFGFQHPRKPFVDIQNQRPAVADEKAQLCMELNRVLRRIPKSINSASINETRAYLAERDRALKVLSAKRSSRVELQHAIKSMMRFEAEA